MLSNCNTYATKFCTVVPRTICFGTKSSGHHVEPKIAGLHMYYRCEDELTKLDIIRLTRKALFFSYLLPQHEI